MVCLIFLVLIEVTCICFLMTDLNLPYPKMMDIAVPANLVCGWQDDKSKPQ